MAAVSADYKNGKLGMNTGFFQAKWEHDIFFLLAKAEGFAASLLCHNIMKENKLCTVNQNCST
jgi:hypothetical protein